MELTHTISQRKISEKLFARTIACSIIVAITSLMWDAWWHIAVGRDTFWEPPHIFLYTAVTTAIVIGIYSYLRTRERLWRNLAFTLLLIVLSAPFDDLWHRLFGAENLSTPLIVWSPPHLILFGSLAASCFMVLPLLRKDNRFFEVALGSPLFSAAITMTMLLVGPLYPLGPYKLFGFWGAGALALVFIYGYLAARDWLPSNGAVTLVSVTCSVLYFIYSASPAPGILIPSFPLLPGFIVVFSYLFPALLLDITKGRGLSRVLEGLCASILYGALMYGTAVYFISSQFAYTPRDFTVAIFSCAVGGALAGYLSLHSRRIFIKTIG